MNFKLDSNFVLSSSIVFCPSLHAHPLAFIHLPVLLFNLSETIEKIHLDLTISGRPAARRSLIGCRSRHQLARYWFGHLLCSQLSGLPTRPRPAPGPLSAVPRVGRRLPSRHSLRAAALSPPLS